MIRRMTLAAGLLSLLALSGCAPGSGGSGGLSLSANYGGSPPIVTARESASASLTLIACPLRAEGGALVGEMIQALQQQSPVVTASEAGSARLILNLCPSLPTAEMLREIGRMRGTR